MRTDFFFISLIFATGAASALIGCSSASSEPKTPHVSVPTLSETTSKPTAAVKIFELPEKMLKLEVSELNPSLTFMDLGLHRNHHFQPLTSGPVIQKFSFRSDRNQTLTFSLETASSGCNYEKGTIKPSPARALLIRKKDGKTLANYRPYDSFVSVPLDSQEEYVLEIKTATSADWNCDIFYVAAQTLLSNAVLTSRPTNFYRRKN